MNRKYVFDTSALLTLILDEAGSDTVHRLMIQAKRRSVDILISFITMTELYYRVCRNEGEDAANEMMAFVRSLPIEVIESNDILNLSAGRIKAQHKVSLADAFVAATTFSQKATLVHKDLQFASLAQEMDILTLPYKK